MGPGVSSSDFEQRKIVSRAFLDKNSFLDTDFTNAVVKSTRNDEFYRKAQQVDLI
jgi:hypothetical protein